jgi:hypothetical protein
MEVSERLQVKLLSFKYRITVFRFRNDLGSPRAAAVREPDEDFRVQRCVLSPAESPAARK